MHMLDSHILLQHTKNHPGHVYIPIVACRGFKTTILWLGHGQTLNMSTGSFSQPKMAKIHSDARAGQPHFASTHGKVILAMYTFQLLLAGASKLQFYGSGMVKP
jgi:hypothetical protein